MKKIFFCERKTLLLDKQEILAYKQNMDTSILHPTLPSPEQYQQKYNNKHEFDRFGSYILLSSSGTIKSEYRIVFDSDASISSSPRPISTHFKEKKKSEIFYDIARFRWLWYGQLRLKPANHFNMGLIYP